MGTEKGAATFQNQIIKDNFNVITKESILSVLGNSCDYFYAREKGYKEARVKARKEIMKYLALVEIDPVDKLYWDGILTMDSALPKPLFLGEGIYEVIKARLTTLNYGGS